MAEFRSCALTGVLSAARRPATLLGSRSARSACARTGFKEREKPRGQVLGYQPACLIQRAKLQAADEMQIVAHEEFRGGRSALSPDHLLGAGVLHANIHSHRDAPLLRALPATHRWPDVH